MPTDLFISHASEDSEVVARPLAHELQRRGWVVWFDEFELTLGDSLRRSIDHGLAEARFGLVILSPSFFAKDWPQRELDGLTARETLSSDKVILPVWHDVDAKYVARFSPPLADRLAVQSTLGTKAMVDQIERALARPRLKPRESLQDQASSARPTRRVPRDADPKPAPEPKPAAGVTPREGPSAPTSAFPGSRSGSKDVAPTAAPTELPPGSAATIEPRSRTSVPGLSTRESPRDAASTRPTSMTRPVTWGIRATILVVALAVLIAALVTALNDEPGTARTATTGVQTFAAGTTMKKLRDAGEITVGVKFDVPPFGFKDTSGEVQGFDIDLAKAITDELGVTPKYIEALSDNRIAFLKDGTADLILSTMTITAERDEEIDFSEPYFVAKGRILVKKDDTSINGVDDLAGKNVCTALGSTYEETLKKQAPMAKLRLVDAYSECLELIQNGGVDAVSSDEVILTGMIRQDDELMLVDDKELTTEPYGAGVKEGDSAFKEFVDSVIAAYKEDGRWATAYQKWVGQYTGEKQEPPTMTLQEALDLSK